MPARNEKVRIEDFIYTQSISPRSLLPQRAAGLSRIAAMSLCSKRMELCSTQNVARDLGKALAPRARCSLSVTYQKR